MFGAILAVAALTWAELPPDINAANRSAAPEARASDPYRSPTIAGYGPDYPLVTFQGPIADSIYIIRVCLGDKYQNKPKRVLIRASGVDSNNPNAVLATSISPRRATPEVRFVKDLEGNACYGINHGLPITGIEDNQIIKIWLQEL